MTMYAVLKSYDKDDSIYYQVLPYNLQGTIKCHFEFYGGFKSLIPFLAKCRLSEKSANKLKMKKEKHMAFFMWIEWLLKMKNQEKTGLEYIGIVLVPNAAENM